MSWRSDCKSLVRDVSSAGRGAAGDSLKACCGGAALATGRYWLILDRVLCPGHRCVAWTLAWSRHRLRGFGFRGREGLCRSLILLFLLAENGQHLINP